MTYSYEEKKLIGKVHYPPA